MFQDRPKAKMGIDTKPPEGMKTVMYDGMPVGYVKDVDDPEEFVRLAQELLKSKGLWRDTPKSKIIYVHARSFDNTSADIYNKNLKSLPREPQGFCPFVVNAAFSAELYLKCLQEIHSGVTESHVLTDLFKVFTKQSKRQNQQN